MARKCPVCKTENPEKAKFCSKCGASLTPQKESTEQYSTVRTKTPHRVSRVPLPGLCYYHQSIQAEYICSRCGRPICRNCAQKIAGMIFCITCAPATRVKEVSLENAIPGVLTLILAAVIIFSSLFYNTLIEIMFDLIVGALLIVSAVGMFYSKKWAGGIAITVIIVHWFFMPLVVFPLVGIPLRYYLNALLPLLLQIDTVLIFILRIGGLISIFLAWSKFT